MYVWQSRHGTGSRFVTQRPSDPGIQRPGHPVDPVTLFYNELQMSTYVADKRLQSARGLPVFTARCYASAVLAMGLCLSVCLSVRLSQVGVPLKRLNVGSQK